MQINDKIPVSVVISTKNEEINLPNCLETLKDFSQVLVVDSLSTDRTSEIVQLYKWVEYISFKWNGQFPKKRNWVLRNIALKNDWILFLDADEVLTYSFIQELKRKITNTEYAAYIVSYDNVFMERTLRYGDRMTKLPLFKKNAGEYEHIDETYWSHLDMEIHEHPVIEGKIGYIKSPIIHHDYKGLDHYIARHNAYSTWEAKRYFHLKTNKNAGVLTSRQKLKYALLDTGLLPFLYFIGAYFFKLGLLDGKPGFNLAVFKAIYFYQIRAKIQELKLIEKTR